MVRCYQLCVLQAEERGDSLEDEAAEEGVPQYGELREQDRFLPIANVARIMKKAIPAQVCTYPFTHLDRILLYPTQPRNTSHLFH